MREQWADARSRCGGRAPLYCRRSAMLCHQHCTSASEGRRTPRAPRKATVMGNSVGSETGSTGRPGSAGPPTDELCASVGFCSMDRCQNPQPTPQGNRFMSPGGKGGAAKVAGSSWRGTIRRDAPQLSAAPPACGVPGILPFYKKYS